MDEETEIDVDKDCLEVACRTCRYVRFCENEVQKCCKYAPTTEGFPLVEINDWCGEHEFVEGYDEQ